MGKIGDDKKNHIIAFTLIYLVIEPYLGSVWALGVTALLAAIVEFIDFAGKKGEPSVLDFVASIALPLIHAVLIFTRR